MKNVKLDLPRGETVDVTVASASSGTGVMVVQRFGSSQAGSTTVTCSCTDNGKTYTTTKECPGTNNTCDCSTPSKPKITCG